MVFRSLLLAAAVFLYFADREMLDFTAAFRGGFKGGFLLVVWVFLAVSMVFRIFPNRRIAMGARKHFSCSYDASPSATDGVVFTPAMRKSLNKGAFLSGLAWVLLNAAVYLALSALDMLSPAALVVLLLAYSVCDMVCILFFCPFRVFFMRNRCCVVCRIYNWDCFMICTPMVIFPSVFSLSLLLISVAVLLRWEIALRRNPEFFVEECNENLSCEKCRDKPCRF